ncbi:MAG: hypothetical protein GY710_01380 [Desulfobacteraceae bacterium]|nr:hypothetical protein [Desulfobacteraceae bacterium]
MEPRIETKSAFKVIGLQYRGKNEMDKCRDLWGAVLQRFDEFVFLAKKPVIPLGIHTGYDEENQTFLHTACFEVETFKKMPDDMVALDIPEQDYAVFECTFFTIMDTLDLFKNWSKRSGCEKSEGPELLHFDQPFDKAFNPHKTEFPVHLYIPVIKR